LVHLCWCAQMSFLGSHEPQPVEPPGTSCTRPTAPPHHLRPQACHTQHNTTPAA
jgi:hypothetical protein